MPRRFGYDPITSTYYEVIGGNRLKPIPIESVRQDVNRFAIGVQGEIRQLTAKMIDGAIPPPNMVYRDNTAHEISLHRSHHDRARK